MRIATLKRAGLGSVHMVRVKLTSEEQTQKWLQCGTREKTRQLKAVPALSKILSSVHSTHLVVHN